MIFLHKDIKKVISDPSRSEITLFKCSLAVLLFSHFELSIYSGYIDYSDYSDYYFYIGYIGYRFYPGYTNQNSISQPTPMTSFVRVNSFMLSAVL